MEDMNYTFKYLAPKTYYQITERKGKIMKIKGYNGKTNISLDEFTYGYEFLDNTKSKKVSGGKVIYDDTNYKIREREVQYVNC